MSGGFGRLVAVWVAVRALWRRRRGDAPGTRPVDGASGAGSVQGDGIVHGAGGDGQNAASNGSGDYDPRRRTVPADPRAELIVALLLFCAAGTALSFIALYIVDGTSTQVLGIAMGVTFLLLAAAVILAGQFVVPQETSVESRDSLAKPTQDAEVAELLHSGGEGISRRGLLTCAGCVAGGAVAAAALTPLASIGPAAGALHASPWRRGVRMVDVEGQVMAASDVQIGSFYTAMPEHGNFEALGAPLLVVRLPDSMIHLPAARDGWAPEGILAFSKICPHAGCAISLYRYPTYAADSSDSMPAFTCPCHYSTFAPGEGGKLIFGPAGRELPQLPVMIDDEGNLRSAGDFDSDVGPSWWGVRRA